MATPVLARIRAAQQDQRGAVAIIVAVCMVVLCMGAALAIDTGVVAQAQRTGQHATDQAAVSGAELLAQQVDTPSQVVGAVEAYLEENYPDLASANWDSCPSSTIPSGYSAPSGSAENCITLSSAGTAVHVTLPPQALRYGLARVGGLTGTTVDPSATAGAVGAGIAKCALCLLTPTGTTLEASGTPNLAVTGADIVDDSSSSSAVSLSGDVSITSPGFQIVGTNPGVSESGNISITPAPTTGASVVPDPLAHVPAPTTSSTIPSGTFSCSSKGSTTLSPGAYGSVSVSGQCNVTLPPGNYSNISISGSKDSITFEPGGPYFITGSFTESGSPTITGTGVMLYFTCSSSNQVKPCTSGQAGGSIALSGSGTTDLSPETSGTYAGLTLFYDRDNAASLAISGTPGLSLSGTLYAKSATMDVSGTSTTLASMIIVGSLDMSGTGTVSVNYEASQNAAVAGGTAYLCVPGTSC